MTPKSLQSRLKIAKNAKFGSTESGKLLVGSENFYSPESTFSELMVEIQVPDHQRKLIIERVFRSLGGSVLVPKYGVADICIHACGRLEGYVFLPCQEEVTYWDLVTRYKNVSKNGSSKIIPEYSQTGRIYHLLEYRVGDQTHVLAFDRGYGYCGDVSTNAFEWLISNCRIRQVTEKEQLRWTCAYELTETSPLKDYFMQYHPIARRHKAFRGYWIEEVLDINQHRDRIKVAKTLDITSRKIERP
ncbi:hypothetical protein KFU94_45505 [Chloroflexi bacterium TSY]|nr:hypothetical protein [Chloroflexi bacterium TSY]